MIRVISILVICSMATGCSINQTVDPVGNISSNEICIIENVAVRAGFLPELKNALQAKNLVVSMLNSSATIAECPLVITYVARWSWDLTIYMSYVEIAVFQNGRASGKALYDARSGGARLDKFIDAEPKIRELVNELFPSQYEVIEPRKLAGEAMPVESNPDQIVESSSEALVKNKTRSAPDLYKELLKLDDLRKREIITDEEFDAEKKKLLDRN